MGVRIEKPGVLTMVQDQGRYGYQQYGVTVCGAIDQRSFTWANLLVGNKTTDAALEMTLMGADLLFTSDTVIAITGADMSPKLNGKPIDSYRAIPVSNGDTLTMSYAQSGCRTYVAFSGGIIEPTVMGSKATFMLGKFGGHQGRKLAKDDHLELGVPSLTPAETASRAITPEKFSDNEITLRVLMGPQDDAFSDEGKNTFFSNTYTITKECDRMGIRLDGAEISHVPSSNGNINSDGIAFGSIQVPPNGKPIIMMADRQPTGGYTKIAAVISVDIPLLAQAKPGMHVRFEKVDISQAQTLYCEQFQRYEDQLKMFLMPPATKVSHYKVYVNDMSYDISLEAIE